MEVSIAISVAALVISLLTLLHTIIKSDRDRQALALRKREEQLIILSGVKKDLQRIIFVIKKIGNEKGFSENDIEQTVAVYSDLLSESEEHFDWLEKNINIKLKTLYSMSHRINSIQMRISSDAAEFNKIV